MAAPPGATLESGGPSAHRTFGGWTALQFDVSGLTETVTLPARAQLPAGDSPFPLQDAWKALQDEAGPLTAAD